jgi:hypothetical protein
MIDEILGALLIWAPLLLMIYLGYKWNRKRWMKE